MNYKKLRRIFRENKSARRVIMDIVDFCDLLNEVTDDKKMQSLWEPVTKRDLLVTGFYAKIKIDDNIIDVYVDKKMVSGQPVFK